MSNASAPNPSAARRGDALLERATSDDGSWSAYAKWGGALDAGFTVIPDVLLRAQQVLELDPVDLAIILNLVMHWWRTDELPHPRPSVIAKRIGVTTRTVERRLAKLQERQLLVRLPPEKSKDNLTVRRFDLRGLVHQLAALAAMNLADRPRSRVKQNSS